MADQPSTEWELATCRHVAALIDLARSGRDPRHRRPEQLPNAPPPSFSALCPHAARVVDTVMCRPDPPEYVPAKDWSTVTQWKCRQVTLRQLCGEVGRSPPAYQRQTFGSTISARIHRFFVVVPATEALQGIHTVGRYSTDEYLALEDAASKMIGNILHQTGKHLDDYNYERISPTEMQNAELQWEVDYVKRGFKSVHS
ncbi:hypothetical protein PIB30_045458 [Stylosanthes scabra]|uniref:Uncharacterized protein n=1 Tax=Stylosanthes scabra TaxID=79078 RepID=A0ABU6UET0_9FABA|nr:hypothetical protein [Stylosanthes scabra]